MFTRSEKYFLTYFCVQFRETQIELWVKYFGSLHHMCQNPLRTSDIYCATDNNKEIRSQNESIMGVSFCNKCTTLPFNLTCLLLCLVFSSFLFFVSFFPLY